MAAALSVAVLACESDRASDATISAALSSGATNCGQFPQLQVETPPGICVGIAATGFVKLRGIGQLGDGDLVVADTGHLAMTDGTVWRLHRNASGALDRRLLLSGLDRPASIAVAPDGLVYVGAASAVIRLDPNLTAPVGDAVIVDLPSAPRPPDPSEDHLFKAIAFDQLDPTLLYVTVGSGSNVCEQPGGVFPDPCPELSRGEDARAEVRRYSLRRGSCEVVATGLRNPFALAVHPDSDLVVAVDNGRDAIDALDPSLTPEEGELPHESLDVLVRAGGSSEGWRHTPPPHFGWPYCYDDAQNNPEYPTVDCRVFARPRMLLPAHAAPLGMAYYTRRMFPPVYRGGLFVTYHGYRDHGHRIVWIRADRRGEPIGPPLDVVRGWDATASQPRGQPFALLVARDGSIYVTDDDNGDLLRLVYDSSGGDGAPLPPLEQ